MCMLYDDASTVVRLVRNIPCLHYQLFQPCLTLVTRDIDALLTLIACRIILIQDHYGMNKYMLTNYKCISTRNPWDLKSTTSAFVYKCHFLFI